MSSIVKKFALWGLPNTSKTSFLGTLLHSLKEEATNQNPEFEFVKSYRALMQNQWPPKLDLVIDLVRFQIEDGEVPYEIYLLDPPGAFLDPKATTVTCPEPFENLSLYQFYAQCDGIIALFDHRTSQGERLAVENALGHLFKQLLMINPAAIKPHFVYGLTKIHPDSNPSPTQHPPLTYLSHRVIDPENGVFNGVDVSRRPHENNTFWVITAFERENKVDCWTGKTFNVRDMLNRLLKPKFHPQAPPQLNVETSLRETLVHGQSPQPHLQTGTHITGQLPAAPPSAPVPQTPPPAVQQTGTHTVPQPVTNILNPLQRPSAVQQNVTSPPATSVPNVHGGQPVSSNPGHGNFPVTHGTMPVSTPPESAIPAPPPTLPETMPRIFVSHNTLDAGFINPLVDVLRQQGVEVWKAPESILPGEDWVDAIERGLSQSTHVVLLISPAAVESEWVRLEMNTAIRLEREGKIKIIPLNYQPCDVPLLWGNYQAISCANPSDQVLSDLMRRLGMAV